MQVNKLNNTQQSFKRVIKVNNIHNPFQDKTKYSAGDSINEIGRVLNYKTSTIYSRDEQGKIRKFFSQITGDYNHKALTRRIPNLGVVLVTGKDYEKILKLESKQKVKYDYVSSIPTVNNYRVEKALLSKLEDGTGDKNRTIIEVHTNTINKPYDYSSKIGIKADKLACYSYKRQFFPEIDGHVCRDKMLPESDTRYSKAINLTCDFTEMTLDN